MSLQPGKSDVFWASIPEVVRSKVEPVLHGSDSARAPIVGYLRDLEVIARAECPQRDTIQVIASGRRLIGDCVEIHLDDERVQDFDRCLEFGSHAQSD